jgi:hypothetical protein
MKYVIFGTEKKLDNSIGIKTGSFSNRITNFSSRIKHLEIAKEVKKEKTINVYIVNYHSFFNSGRSDKELIEISELLI